jgi:hypothetical protein
MSEGHNRAPVHETDLSVPRLVRVVTTCNRFEQYVRSLNRQFQWLCKQRGGTGSVRAIVYTCMPQQALPRSGPDIALPLPRFLLIRIQSSEVMIQSIPKPRVS